MIPQSVIFFVLNLIRLQNAFSKWEEKENTDERNFQLFTLTIDGITMNHPTIYVTHVELSSSFIKIHGQTNRKTAQIIDMSMPTIINIFSTYPEPVINMLYDECMVLVYSDNKYFRGKFIGADAEKTANVLLIDMGYTITVELANVMTNRLTVLIQCRFLTFFFGFIDTSVERIPES